MRDLAMRSWQEFRKKSCRLGIKFLQREDGATAVEYSILVVAIAGVIVATVFSLGGKVLTSFTILDTVMSGS